MGDATFTLGQRGSHYFQCPSRRDYTRLPFKLQQLLTTNHIYRVYHVTLGFEDSFLITYQDRDGRDNMESHGLPDELTSFLYATNSQDVPIRVIPKIRLTLGPNNDSFFVGDGSAYLWLNLPPRLLTALQSRIRDGQWTDRPRLVALGADQNFILITHNSKAVWDLSHYRTLTQMLEFSRTQERGLEEIRQVVLHAYRYQGFIAQNSSANLMWENLPDWSIVALDGMRAPLIRDAREDDVRARQRKLQSRPSFRERPSGGLREQATFRREWTERNNEFKTKAKGMKLSLSLSIGIGGFSKKLG
ncbi:hypothetical protein B0J11DRAFT_581794 [Dendryphion nanum]|uniref:Uncharacterized protein n=1 Tax=Dendryphion nanum TaxID=256645 RepID=A0A9P9DKP5_9PLEO|nr:hypothetical protein B0J11DRAFT_581794 [Dendryphion nanum]